MVSRIYFLISLFFHTLQTVLIKKTTIISTFSLTDILFLRSFFSFLLLNIILFIIFKTTPNSTISREIYNLSKQKKKKKLFYLIDSCKTFWIISFLTAITSYLWHFSVKQIPVNNAMLISYFSILIIPLLSKKIFKEKNSNIFSITILTFISLVIFLNKKLIVPSFNIYYLLIFLDVFLFSLLTVQKKKYTNIHNPLKIIYFVFLSVSFTLSLLTDNVIAKLFNLKNIKEISLLCIIFICYFLEIILRIFSIKLANIKYIEGIKLFRFIYSAVLSYIFLHEKPSKEQFVFILIIIIFNTILYKLEKTDQVKLKS